ncbi:hypothetical protein BGW39_001840 [Mortierella sp. 14UC]|nr:hypothetical protein BGW39_001840 [Mortierella sp. 14UC]
MDDNPLTLFCLVDGEAITKAFPVMIEPTKTIGDLKKLVKAEIPDTLNGVDAKDLTLWRVSIPVVSANKPKPIVLNEVESPTRLDPTDDVSDVLPDKPPKKTIHVIVQRPLPGTPVSHPSTPLSLEAWEDLVSSITEDFFSSPLTKYTNLVQFIKGSVDVPTTGGTLSGLPCVPSRGSEERRKPSLLFLNLPASAEAQSPPCTVDLALEELRGRHLPMLPLFGVSGCGKTRTAHEMLCKTWGFYFNASNTDLGSGDLYLFATLTQGEERYKGQDTNSNAHVHILALALVLARIILLQRCFDIAEQEGTTFTCKHWMLLQAGLLSLGFVDLFASLFGSFAGAIHSHSISTEVMRILVQARFSQLRERLMMLTFSTSSKDPPPKILLVVDEAQNFGTMAFGSYRSETNILELRPILSPLVHGFYRTVDDVTGLCIVPCGTGLSIYDLAWLEDSADSYKGQALGPFTDFQGWESVEQVRTYRDVVRRSLLTDEARDEFDSRVPDEALPELFERLRGRFRPIVTAIERMLAPDNGESDWRAAIDETEDSLISTNGQHHRSGNIAYAIHQMISRVEASKTQYRKYRDIRMLLRLFVLQYYLHGRPVVLHSQEATLVEASVGRIMGAGRKKRTILDEPFALRATVNFFRKDDPGFHSAICSMLAMPSKPSALGAQWELAVLPSLVHVFNNKVLSQTALVPPEAAHDDYDLLNSNANIVGLNDSALGTHHRRMSLSEFLEAHVKNGSRKDGEQVPAFYHLAEMPSGPDIAFVLNFGVAGLCPVFIQLKLCTSLSSSKTQAAFATVKADAVQSHLGKTELESFCTATPKRFFGVVVAYPTELSGVEGTLPKVRRSERTVAEQVEQVPRCILLRIDASNIGRLFPAPHVEALDILKGVKRNLGLDDDEKMVEEHPAKHHRT